MIKKRAPNWTYKHFNDKQILEYFEANPIEEFKDVAAKFHSIKKGAHRADLFRYYFLYIEGGVFIDSDAMIEMDLDTIVKDNSFFSVDAVDGSTVFQGFIGATKQNLIIYRALQDAYNIDVEQLDRDYLLLCRNLYHIIYDNVYDFKIKMFYEVWSDFSETSAKTLDENRNTVLIHYCFHKVIPQWSSKESY